MHSHDCKGMVVFCMDDTLSSQADFGVLVAGTWQTRGWRTRKSCALRAAAPVATPRWPASPSGAQHLLRQKNQHGHVRAAELVIAAVTEWLPRRRTGHLGDGSSKCTARENYVSFDLYSIVRFFTPQEGVQRRRQPLRRGRPAAAGGRDAQIRKQVRALSLLQGPLVPVDSAMGFLLLII